MDCQGYMYVIGVPESHGTGWPGRYKQCQRLGMTGDPMVCRYECQCPEPCGYLQVVHMSNNPSAAEIKICYINAQWLVCTFYEVIL